MIESSDQLSQNNLYLTLVTKNLNYLYN